MVACCTANGSECITYCYQLHNFDLRNAYTGISACVTCYKVSMSAKVITSSSDRYSTEDGFDPREVFRRTLYLGERR